MTTRECGVLYLKEKRYRLLLKLWGKERGTAEERFNPNHDPKTGRFTSGSGLDKSAGSGIIKSEIDGTAGNDVHYVGKIDKNIYSCVTKDITTDEVVLTDVQREHIRERHPNDFERFSRHFPEIIAEPDYILEANKSNTAVVLKQIFDEDENFKLILRLKVSEDPADYKNSVISFWKVNKTEWKRLLRNQKILYNRLDNSE